MTITGSATVSISDISGSVTTQPMELGAAVNQARRASEKNSAAFVLVGFGDCPIEGCDYGFNGDGRACDECVERTEDALIAG